MIKNKTIFIKNIYYMLSYAFQNLQQDIYKDVLVEPFENMYNLLAAILAKGIGIQIKQGLYKEYVNINDNTPVLKGKINMPGTINNRISQKHLLACEFDYFSENNILNQIIKTTVFLLLNNTDVKPKYKSELKNEMMYFSNVSLLKPSLIKWNSLKFHRNNKNYQMLIGICNLIIDGMLLTTDSGEYKLASFFDEMSMSKLYEKFVLEYYKKHFPEIKVSAPYISWSLDNGADNMLPTMKTDIYLQKGNTILIIDTKYYSSATQNNFEKRTIHSGNLYQIFTYVKNCKYSFDKSEYNVSGMLLYAKTNEDIQPDNEYIMHGNKISVRTLDLNCDFESIKWQLDKIINEHFGD